MITSLLEVHRTTCVACAGFERIECSKELNGCLGSLDELSVCASDTHIDVMMISHRQLLHYDSKHCTNKLVVVMVLAITSFGSPNITK